MYSFSLRKSIRTRLTSFLLLAGLLLPSLLPVQAGLFSGPSVKVPSSSDFATDMERRYHVNPESVQEQGETLNVADGKKMAPEVSIFFSPSDPKEGEKITARAFPLYFVNDTNQMYFTWYLQRSGCEEDSTTTETQRRNCDRDGNGNINVEDWKIEAARILAGNGFDPTFATGPENDNDGYRARFGGDNRVNTAKDYCYYHDNSSGNIYELVEDVGSTTYDGCVSTPANPLEVVCMVGNSSVSSGTQDPLTGGDTFGVTGTDDTVSGYPYCSSEGTIACVTGTPCCVSDAVTATSCTTNITATTCSVSSSGDSDPVCKHLFPRPSDSGNGSFGLTEEQFWGTDPQDPSTADNGNKDEANIVGLGQDNFTWNYVKGDKVGVVVEGTSMMPTKHADSSNMIMWAFSKNDCKLDGDTGSYQKNIKGYNVVIPTTDMDLNECLDDNLVDPVQGGQATNLEVNLSATPDDPINDSTDGNNGDTLVVNATVNNSAQGANRTYFDWKVDISRNGIPNPAPGDWVSLVDAEGKSPLNNLPGDRKLLSPVKGNGISSVRLALNLRAKDILGSREFDSYLEGGVGYLRFRLDVAENFSTSGASRRGKSDIIVKFNSSADRISAHTVTPNGDPARLVLNDNQEICSGVPLLSGTETEDELTTKKALARLDTKLCRVIKNEIIGLKVVESTPLDSFNWTINGLPLVCNTRVSSVGCADDKQNGINFFPVVGNVGDVFTVTVTGTRVGNPLRGSSAVSVGQTVTISRAFKIVEPEVAIVSADQNQAWPKVLGRYVDANGVTYPDYSKTTLQAFSGSQVKLEARFTPDFLGSRLPPEVERSWTVDGETVGDGSSGVITFSTLKEPGSIYNIGLSAVYRPNALTRKAMQDIWQISNLDSTEVYFSTGSQLEHPEELIVAKTGVNKYLALASSYLPASLLFAIRIFLTAGLILFVTGFLFALIPNAPARFERLRRE